MHWSKIGPRLAGVACCDVVWDEDTLKFYSFDASPYRIKPRVVAYPTSEIEIIKILKFASRYRVPVTPRGGGTGLVGGALGNGIIMDMRNFNKISVGKNTVVVGGGVFKGRLDKELRRHGRFLGPNPSIGPFCTIGGMIGTNASGSRSLKYGSTVDNMISVKVITSNGAVLSLPFRGRHGTKFSRILDPAVRRNFPKVSKNSSGYRLDKVSSSSESHKIIAGSEGTLGVIVSAKMKTIPIPRKTVLIIASYNTLREALADVPNILKIGPSALEVIDSNIVRHMGGMWPGRERSLLFIEFDDHVSMKSSKIRRIIPGKIIKSTSKAGEIRKWWTYRNSALSYSLRSISRDEVLLSLMEDPAVPVHRLPLLLDLVDHLKSRYRMRVIVYGHAGNGNLHIRPILKKASRRFIHRIASEFFHGVISIGGTISGEHGDGLSRTGFVKLQYGEKTYSSFKELKEFFDPTNTLNPNKVVTGGK